MLTPFSEYCNFTNVIHIPFCCMFPVCNVVFIPISIPSHTDPGPAPRALQHCAARLPPCLQQHVKYTTYIPPATELLLLRTLMQ